MRPSFRDLESALRQLIGYARRAGADVSGAVAVIDRLDTSRQKPELNQARLKELFWYDPESGKFWRLATNKVTGTTAGNGYIVLNIYGKQYSAHRLAFLYMTGEWPEDSVDHINHIKSDNRWSNLRDATGSENLQNRRVDKVSDLESEIVRDKRSGVWRARLGENDLGSFEEFSLAQAAVIATRGAEFRKYNQGTSLVQ